MTENSNNAGNSNPKVYRGIFASNRVKILLPLIGFFVLGTVVVTLWNVNHNEGYAPAQPIPFSHKIHAGINKIDCLYCHTGANKSRHSSVPSMNVCMNCHTVVKADSPFIKKVQEVAKSGQSFEWVKVHDLPDHVLFNHKRHIAKGLDCTTCHGDVRNMDVITQIQPLTMGWCLNCHNGLTTPDHVLANAGVKRGQQVAPTNCVTCHK